MTWYRASWQLGAPRNFGISDLTPRQIEVLRLAAAGFSGKQIARRLGVSVRTVEGHFTRMRQRTGARNTGELVARGLTAGIVIPGLARPAWQPRMRVAMTGGIPRGTNYRSALSAASHADNWTTPAGRSRPCRKGAGTSTPHGPNRPDPALPAIRSPEAGTPPQALIGYARVLAGQNLTQEIHRLQDAGCAQVFADQPSGAATARPGLDACLAYLRSGDTLVVPSLDQLSDSLEELINVITGLHHRDLAFRSLYEALGTTAQAGEVICHTFAALSKFIREYTSSTQEAGTQAVRTKRDG